jgi:hypothetical protein
MKIQAIVLVWLLCLLAAGGASMQNTVGQTAIGIANDGYTIEAGYWYRDAGGESEVCGDVNGDGVVTAADAVIALEIAAGGSASCDPETFTAADVSGDGQVTSLDALMILQKAAGAIEIC